MAGNGNDAGFEVLISSDSHVMEPSEILAERAPQSFKDQVPRFPKLEVGSSFQTHPGGSDPTHRIKEMETDGSAPKCSTRRICCRTSLWTTASSRQSVSAPTTIG